MPHICGQVPTALQLSSGHTLNDLLLLFIKDLLVWATSIFGGQVKFEILVAQGHPHHFWISETLYSVVFDHDC
jgi:hypothetical protein